MSLLGRAITVAITFRAWNVLFYVSWLLGQLWKVWCYFDLFAFIGEVEFSPLKLSMLLICFLFKIFTFIYLLCVFKHVHMYVPLSQDTCDLWCQRKPFIRLCLSTLWVLEIELKLPGFVASTQSLLALYFWNLDYDMTKISFSIHV